VIGVALAQAFRPGGRADEGRWLGRSSRSPAVSVQNQDRAEFDSLLKRALAVDPDARPGGGW
jgi:hypothetical protein